MNCLLDYIGLAGCGASSPASGLFINSLPGISLKAIDSLADVDQVNYVGVWKDAQTRAIKRLELMIISEMAKNTALKGVKFQTSTFAPVDNASVNVDQVVIVLNSDCNSPFQFHYINQLKIDDVFNGSDWIINVFDQDTTEQIDQIFYTGALSNVDYIPINKKYYRQNIFLRVYKSGNTQYHNSYIDPIVKDCVNISFGKYTLANSTTTINNNSYGINLNGYALGCDATNLACDNKALFATPLWYLCGSELMMERIASNRINFWTMDRKQAEELKAFFDVEAEKSVKMAMNGVSFADCDCCTKCDPLVAIREARL